MFSSTNKQDLENTLSSLREAAKQKDHTETRKQYLEFRLQYEQVYNKQPKFIQPDLQNKNEHTAEYIKKHKTEAYKGIADLYMRSTDLILEPEEEQREQLLELAEKLYKEL